MWYYNSQIIKTPRAMQIGDLKYSKGLFKDATKMAELGIKPYSQVTPDNRYYHNGAYTVDTSGAEVVGTYAGTARDVATLTANMLDTTKSAVTSRMKVIDWYWVRASKSGGTAVPSAIATYSATLYTEYAAKKTEIAALNTLAKIIAYEATPYTETRKVEHTADNGDVTYGPDTTTATRHINLVTHFTVNPDDDVDPAFVSLVAD